MTRFAPQVLMLAVLVLVAGLMPMVPARSARANTDEQTFQAAVFLLRQSMQVHRDGRHHMLLRSLRHLGDEQLQPLFDQLARSSQPVLQIHGLLGLAECHPDRQLDLVRLAAMQDPAAQAQVVSAAMDSELLSNEQARQLLNWDGLDLAVKVLVAAQLIQQDQFQKMDVLEQAADSDNLARSGLAHLLLLQLGRSEQLEHLQQLSQSSDPRRDEVREMVLRSAIRYDLHTVGPWALKVAAEPGVSLRLSLLALQAAMQFQAPQAQTYWQQQYDSTADMAARTRLALLALRLASHQQPSLFDRLIESEDPLLQQVGRTGLAIATNQQVADRIAELVSLNHPIANGWALIFAREQASEADAVRILAELIEAFERGPERGRARRLDDAVTAVQLMYERSPQAAQARLQPLLASPTSSGLLIQGILLGLIRADTPGADQVLAQTPAFRDMRARKLALLLQARSGRPLDAEQLAELGVLVRGGGIQQDALRIQGAWYYLQQVGQAEAALAQVLGGRG